MANQTVYLSLQRLEDQDLVEVTHISRSDHKHSSLTTQSHILRALEFLSSPSMAQTWELATWSL